MQNGISISFNNLTVETATKLIEVYKGLTTDTKSATIEVVKQATAKAAEPLKEIVPDVVELPFDVEDETPSEPEHDFPYEDLRRILGERVMNDPSLKAANKEFITRYGHTKLSELTAEERYQVWLEVKG